MFFKLLKLEFKSFFRSATFGKSLAVKLFMGFIGLYFFFTFLSLGISLYPLCKEVVPREKPLLVVNSFLLVWLAAELLLRFFFQNLPVLDAKPLLTQRVTRSQVVHALMAKSLFSFYNILTMTVAVPFVIFNRISGDFDSVSLIGWLLTLFGMVLILNFLNFWIQRKFSGYIKALVPFLIICLVLIGLEYYKLFSVTNLFGSFFNLVLIYPVLCLLPFAVLVLCYRLTFMDVKEHLYMDAYLRETQKEYRTADLSWTSRFGTLAPFLELDLKLLWRNKRTRTVVYLSFGFLAYGLLFYTNSAFLIPGWSLFIGLFITGIFVINFGQFIPAWDSSYFALLQTRPITMRTYLKAKALLMDGSVLILTILSTFYVYFGWDKLYVHIVCGVYNAGINIPVVLLFGAYNRKYIDLSNSNVFNYQGIGLAQWLISFPLIILPCIIWFPIKVFIGLTAANVTLLSLGILGLLCRPLILNFIAQLYTSRRFSMLEGFKQRS